MVQVHPVAALLMIASVAMVLAFLYGELWILDIRFNRCAVTKDARSSPHWGSGFRV